MTRAVSGGWLVRNSNLNRRAVALPYRSRKVPLLSTTRDTSFPSFIAFATIPSAVDLRSRTWVYPAFSSFQINSCSAALTCEEPVMLWSVGGRVDGVVVGCASAGNVIARKEATVQAANRQLMMHSPEYARAWMAPHNQPTLGRVVPAIGVSAPARGQPFKQKLAPLTQISRKISSVMQRMRRTGSRTLFGPALHSSIELFRPAVGHLIKQRDAVGLRP
jgi:hypothetical protein